MPVDPDISQSTAGGGYQPGFDPDYDPDQVSSRPNVDSVSKPKRPREKEEPFNIRTAIPTALPKISEGGTSDDAYRAEIHKESLDADRKAEEKKQASKKSAAKDSSSAQGGQSQGSGGEQGAQGQPGQYKSPYKFPAASGGASGGGKPGLSGGAGAAGAKGAGAGKAAGIDPQQIQRGITSAAQRAAQGDFKGAAQGAIQDAATVAAEVGESRAMLFLMAWALPTLGLSLVIGGTALLIANMFVNKRAGTKIEIPGYQKALILALDIAWLLGIALMLIVAVASFCYALTSPSYSARLNAVLASPGSAIAGEVGRFVLPAEVGNFCSSLTGNSASKLGNVNVGSGSGGSGGGSGGLRCQPARIPSPATPENLANSCFGQYGSEVVRQASIVAQAESNGNPSLPVGAGSCGFGKPTARCEGGEIPVWGLFQINLIVHQVAGLDCPSAFRNTSGGRHDGSFCRAGNRCVVVDPVLYNRCVQAAVNATNNINTACRIYQNNIDSGRPGWWDWGNVRNEHANRCGF